MDQSRSTNEAELLFSVRVEPDNLTCRQRDRDVFARLGEPVRRFFIFISTIKHALVAAGLGGALGLEDNHRGRSLRP